jgi:hypothetical protein
VCLALTGLIPAPSIESEDTVRVRVLKDTVTVRVRLQRATKLTLELVKPRNSLKTTRHIIVHTCT